MAVDALNAITRARSNSGSTLKPQLSNEETSIKSAQPAYETVQSLRASLSTHNEQFSREDCLFAEQSLSGSGLQNGDLVEIRQLLEGTATRDFEDKFTTSNVQWTNPGARNEKTSTRPTYLCLVKTNSSRLTTKQSNFEVSINKHIATTFDFTSPSQVIVEKADKRKWTSSHAEICFRDAYLSRSDMWRFACQELVGQTIYVGQKLSFLNSLKATIRSIHIDGKQSKVGYFARTTIPVFRSEAARYVIFVQMSREMWDFDSEGNGEILFNRVVNGFLPELFKRWSKQEVRHLVSIIMFGRLEYRQAELSSGLAAELSNQPPNYPHSTPVDHQDFYRVVVTDMASAQWTTILDELKKDFRVFLRDVSLFKTPDAVTHAAPSETQGRTPPRITGRLSGAMTGNVLEAINLAASQFSNDYIDRDLIRTGISTVVITAGSGVFDVDRDLLKLTSETLTNNGIGIDIVCLSRMPLHSVPLFRYRLKDYAESNTSDDLVVRLSPLSMSTTLPHPSLPDLSSSPAFSTTNASLKYYSKFPSAFPARLPQSYGYGIPQWVDLSYWSSETDYERSRHRQRTLRSRNDKSTSFRPFLPRVRMYELQMMGLMELGMADIAVPYLSERTTPFDATERSWNPRLTEFQYSRSLSRSPELKRISQIATAKPRQGGALRRDESLTYERTLAAMEDYDRRSFQPATTKSVKRELISKDRDGSERVGHKVEQMPIASPKTFRAFSTTRTVESKAELDNRSETDSIMSGASKPVRPARAPRNFSYTVKGLMPFKATTVTANVQVENVKALKMASTGYDANSDESRPKLMSRGGTATEMSKSILPSKDQGTHRSRPGTPNQNNGGSQPITINQDAHFINKKHSALGPHLQHRFGQQGSHNHQPRSNLDDISTSAPDNAKNKALAEDPLTPSSVPESKVAFIRNVNASNPLKHDSHAKAFGRWQHLYPRKPRAATVKWHSLCTPASVPLTTEEFPSSQQLENDYDAITHTVSIPTSDELAEDPSQDIHKLFLELVSIRISHGYQFVTGTAVADALQEDLTDCYALCQSMVSAKARLILVLAMGNTIQKLELNRSDHISITKYVQKPNHAEMRERSAISYVPYIRTILANDYFSRTLTLRGFSEQYPWDAADSHLAGSLPLADGTVDQLRYWRARFVLLPVEPPASTWKKHQADENEEEIHLLGIRALTQLWQRNRYVTVKERRVLQNRSGSTARRDENPLEVKMETLNPSELVALELDKLTQIEEGGDLESTQLLPEPQKLDQQSSMSMIAQAMQGNTGIDIKSRRWHLRLHPNCFHGEEFTNWLLHNVKSISTREEAVEFGNQLMEEGLFEHVNGRHGFKDGNYFYSMKQQYRAPRADTSKSWFSSSRQSEKSIPATPATEHPPRDFSPLAPRTRSGSNIALQVQSSALSEIKTSAEKKRKAVSLSRMIRINVDTKQRSMHGRPEVVNVHYDRFHNPENCYHLELNWLSTTCKLVDDAIVTWTSTADRYGLKLVEVPIAEAYDVPKAEPFRNPYRVMLALEPPKQKPTNVMFNPVYYAATSSSLLQPLIPATADKHVYQKAILKRSNFVLDLEATKEFPEGVDIHYSWGRLDYKYTQFVHRSGVVLAQIMDNGDIILLANRLYNSRFASAKDATSRMFDPKKDFGPHAHRPAVPPTAATSMQASGIVGINLASPSTAFSSSPGLKPIPNFSKDPSPGLQPLNGSQGAPSTPSVDARKPVMADSFGPKSAFAATGLWNTLITPEQIKDDLEAFCQDKARLEAFYKEVANAPVPVLAGGSGSRKTTGSSSSSLLRPAREVAGTTSDITGIPAIELPEAVGPVRHLRRATVAYEATNEMFDRSRVSSRNGSVGSGGTGSERDTGERPSAGPPPPSPLRKGSK